MARNKKTGSNWLAWRLNNPERARENDEAFDNFEKQVTANVLRCQECGGQREVVAADDVPADVRENLQKAVQVEDFIYCSTCKNYSAQGGWESL
jgi:uncharacterized protein with PIN domain